MKQKKIVFLLITALAALLIMAGCGRKYEPLEVPSVEEAQGGITPEGEDETEPMTIVDSAGTKDGQGAGGAGESDGSSGAKAEKSSHDAAVTTETAPAFTAVDETVYVTGDQVNLRKSAGTSGEIAAKLSRGTKLQRTGSSDSWSRVIYQDQECYISSQYVSTKEPETEPAPSAPAVTGSGTGKIIAIDPGHQSKGNSEKEPIGPGASTTKPKVASGTQGNVTGIPEYKLTLAVSLLLKQELLDRGYQVYMIRETNDVNISNAERAQMANGSGADIFVRVHANSLSDTSVSGALTMCQTSKNPYNGSLYSKSSALSKAVTNAICAQTGFRNRGVQETDTMSGINWCTIPVTIVEMGFMSNAEEDRKMATDEYRLKIAKGIADGIDAYYAAGN